jgi:hypothetical protein
MIGMRYRSARALLMASPTNCNKTGTQAHIINSLQQYPRLGRWSPYLRAAPQPPTLGASQTKDPAAGARVGPANDHGRIMDFLNKIATGPRLNKGSLL